MITITQAPNVVAIAVFGEFSLADYKEFEEQVNYKIQFEGKVNLLMDLRDMVGFTVDVAWEEIQFSRKHANDFNRIAILTTDQWVTWSAWVSQIFVKADVQVFDDELAARNWLGIETETVR